MAISIFLAKVLGLYLVIVSLWLFIRCRRAESVMQDIMNSPGMLAFGAVVGLIFGLLIVVSHNVWHLNWVVIITFVGWLVIIKALFNLFFTDVAQRFFTRWIQNRKAMMVSNIITLIIGLFLLYHGFIMK